MFCFRVQKDKYTMQILELLFLINGLKNVNGHLSVHDM